MKESYVYIMASQSRVLYTGVTSDLLQRIWQHKNHVTKGFTSKYNCTSLVYYEDFADIHEAILREKYIKGKKRIFKISLIESMNPDWKDLWDEIIQ